MLLTEFDVEGFRSLERVQAVPIGKPTIITGQNDGGKSATIAALRFLLTSSALTEDDRTFTRPDTAVDGEVSRVAQTSVTGRFILTAEEQAEWALPERTVLRRIACHGASAQLEVRRVVPEPMNLRDLHLRRVVELRAIAEEYGVANNGPANRIESWRTPLDEFAATQPQVEDWVAAPTTLARCLPRFVGFASTSEPNPEQEAGKALRAAFDLIMADTKITGRIEKLEEEVVSRLTREAAALESHIRARCSDLAAVSLAPRLSFSEGYQGVTLRASTAEGEDVTLAGAGAGRRRRINLAVWEWTSKLLDEEQAANGVVVAYDEPDTHLDYGHQRQLMNLIHDQCRKPHVQMLVATHSMNLIDRVDIADVVHLRIENERTVIERLTDGSHEGIDAYLNNLAAALGLRNSVLLHENCFVGVEGPTETQALPLLFKLATGIALQSAGIALIGCNGNEGALKVAKFLNDRGRRVAFVVDNDSTTNRSTRVLFREDKLRSYGFSTAQVHYVGGPHELEELFSDDQWASAANVHWPRDDGVSWTAEAVSAVRPDRKFSEKLCDLFREHSSAGPLGKPDLVYTLASTLTDRDDVPLQLRQTFEALVAFAHGDDAS